MSERVEPCALGDTALIHACGDVLLASQPSVADLALAKKRGVRSVMNQRHASEAPELDEAACVAALGMAYENPAWSGTDELTDESIDAQRELLRSMPRPILFHCAGANRVGAIWFAYRAIDDGLSVDNALAEAKIVGLRSPAYEQIVRDYIARHK